MQTMNTPTCRLCKYAGSDLRLSNCGCTVHVRCVPIGLIASPAPSTRSFNSGDHAECVPVSPNSMVCPFCGNALVSGFQLFPLTTELLDKSSEVRSNACKRSNAKKGSNKDGDEAFQEIQSQSPYLLLSRSTNNAGMHGDSDCQRTGRWTDEEVAYVDYLVLAFDQGLLPLPQGVRLNEFLSEMLLCKGSRLTKKMKNARLSVRAYSLLQQPGSCQSLDYEMLSMLQEKFIHSISNEATKLELRFVITKSWRSYFSNLCLQVGSSMLDASEWIPCLEQMDRRAVVAEETIRKARRRRMGLALKTDVRMGQNGVFYAGVPVNRKADGVSEQRDSQNVAGGEGSCSETLKEVKVDQHTSATHSVTSSDDTSEVDFISEMLDLGNMQKEGYSQDELASFLDEFVKPVDVELQTSRHVKNTCGPFLEEIISYMEKHDLPFQHADLWVPSYNQGPKGQSQEVRLCHAGHATRGDVDTGLYAQLDEYGEYGTKFSFAPGAGLPGRVFSSGNYSWERSLDGADPKVFLRSGGARIYGIKTGFGFPLATNIIGRIVVVMYSVEDVSEDVSIALQCMRDIGQYTPEPKWKLVVELGSPEDSGQGFNSQAMKQPILLETVHYDHKDFSFTAPTPVVSSSSTNAQPFGMNLGQQSSGGEQSAVSQPQPQTPMDEDMYLATLLGNHMPISELPAHGVTGSSPSSLLPHFMSLRLLLLRPAERRLDEEKDLLEIVKKSYRGYAKDTRKTTKELAYLIVRDWEYLSKATAELKKGNGPGAGHQCHVMSAPPISTYSQSGAPTKMPGSLSFVDPSAVSKGGAFANGQRKRRISNCDEDDSLAHKRVEIGRTE